MNTSEAKRVILAGLMAGVVISCGPGGMAMLGDAMVDAGNGLRDMADPMLPDASAQAADRVLTADTDPAQLRSGVTSVDARTGEVIADGPFVLTDVFVIRDSTALSLAVGPTCGDAITVVELADAPATLTGMTLAVAAGESLCVTATFQRGTVSWAGFTPYDD